MTTFVWSPSTQTEAVRTITPRVRKTAFGDGYEQRVGDGINTQLRMWDLTFANRNATDSAAIDSFLAVSGSITAFDWTDLNGHSGKWICDSWKMIPIATPASHRLYTITATFREVVA